MNDLERKKQYWHKNLQVLAVLLSIWFLFSCVLSIFLVEKLNEIQFAGFKLGFWISQQGSILVFILLILAYAIIMHKVDAKYHMEAGATVDEKDTES